MRLEEGSEEETDVEEMLPNGEIRVTRQKKSETKNDSEAGQRSEADTEAVTILYIIMGLVPNQISTVPVITSKRYVP